MTNNEDGSCLDLRCVGIFAGNKCFWTDSQRDLCRRTDDMYDFLENMRWSVLAVAGNLWCCTPKVTY